MAIPPPPNTGSSPISQGRFDILDPILGLYVPTLILFFVITGLSASFALKVPTVKSVGSLVLCGLSLFILFMECKSNGATGLRWTLSRKDWAQLALTVHALYFGVIHDLVSK